MYHRRPRVILPVIAFAALPALPATAWHISTRFVERIGTLERVIDADSIDASDCLPRNIRFQMGVFDDESGPAPLGGVMGFHEGSIVVTGPETNSDDRRNNGRLAPFNTGGPELVIPDGPVNMPFTSIINLDASMNVQLRDWFCDGDQPGPMPVPLARGYNAFVSIYAVQIDPAYNAVSYDLQFAGAAMAAASWTVVGQPVPPDCERGIPGQVQFGPTEVFSSSFDRTLRVLVPAPHAGVALSVFTAAAFRRRRTTVTSR